jgi:hypothetical protein
LQVDRIDWLGGAGRSCVSGAAERAYIRARAALLTGQIRLDICDLAAKIENMIC